MNKQESKEFKELTNKYDHLRNVVAANNYEISYLKQDISIRTLMMNDKNNELVKLRNKVNLFVSSLRKAKIYGR